LTVVQKIIKYQIPSSGSQIVPYRQTDTHDKANSHFLQLREHV